MTTSANWAKSCLAPVGVVYTRLAAFVGTFGRVGEYATKNHFLFFFLAIVCIPVFAPKYLLLLQFVVSKYLLHLPAIKPDTSHLPYTPNIVVAMAVIFLGTFFLPSSYRLAFFVVTIVPAAMIVDGSFDLVSLAVFLLFLTCVYPVVKLSIERRYKLIIVCVLSVTLLYVCTEWSFLRTRAISGLASFQMALIPMVWYSVYEELPPKRRLEPLKFMLYNCSRIVNAPILTYKDLFSASGQTLAQIRFGGIKAIYVALFGAIGVWVIRQIEGTFDVTTGEGLLLLVSSYLFYLKGYFKTMIGFNLFIGIARLFGVPVRDNFNYWLLARTPNEHWRRWNILAREWIITFVFFPIMRSKKWLFAAIMAALLTSGILHVVPLFFGGRLEWFLVWAEMAYWTCNGLAIYLVLKIPGLFPKMMKRLGINEASVFWSVTGVVLTSAFYAVLFTACKSRSLDELGSYLSRLFG